MWVRKTALDKATAVKPSRFSLALPIGSGLILGLLAGFQMQSFELFVFGSIFGFIITYVCQLIFGSRVADDIVSALPTGGFGGSQRYDYFCPSCRGVQLFNPKGCPQCGARLEKAEDWEWKPDEDKET